MNQSEWFTSTHPLQMIKFLTEANHSDPNYRIQDLRVSDRTLRLWVCAICREIWDLYVDARPKNAIELAEEYADGLITPSKLREQHNLVYEYCIREEDRAVRFSFRVKEGPELSMTQLNAVWLAWQVSDVAGPNVNVIAHEYSSRVDNISTHIKSDLLREIFGNPFCAPKLEKRVLAWNGSTVPKLAQEIYDSRNYAKMPLLADALEEAGCEDSSILEHCRNKQRCIGCIDHPGKVWRDTDIGERWVNCLDCNYPEDGAVTTGWVSSTTAHIRGCWVLDLLLGKE